MLSMYGVGAAPECCSFSRAVTPPVRSRRDPLGLPRLTANMARKVHLGNLHAAFVLSILSICKKKDLAYWCENPDGSFLWLLPDWLASTIGAPHTSYRCDFCRYRAPWRKRTRTATNTHL